MVCVLALALLGGSLPGCGTRTRADEPRRLPGSTDSVEELARETLVGLMTRDTARLQRLRLTEYEHNRLIWPELPASRPEANFPVDFAWRNIQLRDRAALLRLLARYSGRPLKYESVECRGETERFVSFMVLTDCRVTFRVEGRWSRHQFFRHVLVMDGEHKIFRYYD